MRHAADDAETEVAAIRDEDVVAIELARIAPWAEWVHRSNDALSGATGDAQGQPRLAVAWLGKPLGEADHVAGPCRGWRWSDEGE